MISLYLFRVKLIRGDILPFEDIDIKALFCKALNEKPALSVSNNSIWHIGNIVYFDKNKITGTFNIGKQTNSNIPKYNNESKDFEENIEESSPNVKIFFNLEYEILAIPNKSSLCPNEDALAKKIKMLLENTNTVKNSFKYIEITKIKDPKNFVSRLRSAYCIREFKVFFSGKNPFDADEYFQKPMSVYLDATGGEKGTTTVKGKSLNSQTCAKMAISVARTGNNATARLQDTSSDKVMSISMIKNEMRITIPIDIEDNDEKIIDFIMKSYYGIKYEK